MRTRSRYSRYNTVSANRLDNAVSVMRGLDRESKIRAGKKNKTEAAVFLIPAIVMGAVTFAIGYVLKKILGSIFSLGAMGIKEIERAISKPSSRIEKGKNGDMIISYEIPLGDNLFPDELISQVVKKEKDIRKEIEKKLKKTDYYVKNIDTYQVTGGVKVDVHIGNNELAMGGV